jgi:hypothetical protein
MKTPMQELIDDAIKHSGELSTNGRLSESFAVDYIIGLAELLLEKEKEVMCEFAVEYIDDCCYADVSGSVGCEDSAEEYFEKTFNTSEQ